MLPACIAPSGYISDCTDCDDGDASVNPAATELCDGVDNDCDGTVDEDDAVGTAIWCLDADGDAFGDPSDTVASCAAPSGYVANCTDCDDDDASVNPAATELCDGVDDDCDGTVDEADAADAATWYQDVDGDTFGDPATGTRACTAPTGLVADGTDCDDTDPSVNPAATELCDGIDNDCDGTVDEDDATDATTWYQDADGDAFGEPATTTRACSQPSGFVADATDCDDADPAVNPAATELCDGIDDDCDGSVDEADAADASAWYQDADGDAFGDPSVTARACSQPSSFVADASDCDDGDPDAWPGALETPYDGIDQDCDGADMRDVDGDGWESSAVGEDDCDDTEAATNPDAVEQENGVDDDCDGLVDEGTEAYDDDGDGFTEHGGDCDDSDSSISPAAVETADGIDQDCDGVADDGTDAYDDDGDGFTEDGGDCDDGDPAIAPGEAERENGLDDDCDGVADEGTEAYDDDGDGLSEVEGDCNDDDAGVHPGAEEAENGVDDDCDGIADEGTDLYDDDGDGYTEDDGDCDDTTAAVSPARAEQCTGDGQDAFDENCDGVVDEGCYAHDTGEGPTRPCGCASGSTASSAWGPATLLGLLWMIARRRRSGRAGSVMALPLLLAGCGSDVWMVPEDQTTRLTPEAPWLDFGAVSVGVPEERSFTLRNTSDQHVRITRVAISPVGDIEVLDCAEGADLAAWTDAAGSSYLTCTLRFTPAAIETYEGLLSYDVARDDVQTLGVPVLGRGVGVDVSFAPSFLDFGEVRSEETLSVALHNSGQGAVRIASCAAPGVPWSLSREIDGLAIPAGESLAFEVSAAASTSAEARLAVELTEGSSVSLTLRAGICDDLTLPEDDDSDGVTVCGGDCDDTDPAVHPGADESPNGIDEDCDGTTDEGTIAYDDDGDGSSEQNGDCDDGDPAISPAAEEIPNGVDDDCDDVVDNGTRAYDDDGDGFTEDGGDCDDAEPAISPAAWDAAGDGVDADCDGND